MLNDGSDELLEGMWPFLKRVLFLFLPLWVFLLAWSAGFSPLISAVASGLSLGLIFLVEKVQLKRLMDGEDSLNK
jgi:TRAP-type uncharacterized transport system fused permease subunit